MSAPRRIEQQATDTGNTDTGVEVRHEQRPIPPALARLPEHLREAAIRSWIAREEDYRYLADR